MRMGVEICANNEAVPQRQRASAANFEMRFGLDSHRARLKRLNKDMNQSPRGWTCFSRVLLRSAAVRNTTLSSAPFRGNPTKVGLARKGAGTAYTERLNEKVWQCCGVADALGHGL